jgi:hypothetical protein
VLPYKNLKEHLNEEFRRDDLSKEKIREKFKQELVLIKHIRILEQKGFNKDLIKLLEQLAKEDADLTLLEEVASGTPSETGFLESYIEINKPDDPAKFLEKLHCAKTFHTPDQDGVVRAERFEDSNMTSTIFNNIIYRSYWLNKVSNLKDVLDGIDWVWSHEYLRGYVKMTFSFGVIFEEAFQNAPPEYHIRYASEDESLYNPPVLVNTQLLPTLKYRILKAIHNANAGGEGSNKKKIAIFNININAYSLYSTGASDPIIHSLIANEYVYSYEGEHNICFFATSVFEEIFNNDSIDKDEKHKLLKPHNIEANTKSEWYKFLCLDEKYDPELSPKLQKYRELLKGYKGFQFCDVMKYIKWKNYNLNVFMYNDDAKRYKMLETYKNPNGNDETRTVNIAQVFLLNQQGQCSAYDAP